MAYGDLIGDLSQAYMSNAERAAKNGVQSLTGGPIARASGQLPRAASLADAAPVVPGQPVQPLSQPTQAASLADAAPKQTSFAATNTPPKYQPQQPQSLASLAPTSTSLPAAVAPSTSQPASLASLAPGGAQAPTAAASQQPVSLDSAFRSTGIGSGTNAIAARVGAGGVPEFSNAPADLASAANAAPVGGGVKQPTSLADLSPGGVSASPSAPLSSLGSAANIGDGVGTFSQAQAGDGQLAMTRFNRAADLRSAFKAQDQLAAAQAAQTRDSNFTVVHDSSQPVTRRELKFDQDREAATQSLADAVNNTQAGIATQRQGVAADQQQRQANRLEDAFTAATSPSATEADKQRYQALKDPTGAGGLDRQIKQTQLANAQLEGQAKQQQITQSAQQTQQAQQDRAVGQAGQLATFDQAIGSVDSLLGTKPDPKNPNGPRIDEDKGLASAVGFSSAIPLVPGTDRANFEARLDTLKAQTFLPQVQNLRGLGALSNSEGDKLAASIGALSTKMTEDEFRKSLREVRATLQGARDRLPKPNQQAAQPTQPASLAPVAQVPSSPGTLAASQPSATSAPVRITTEEAYRALPSGTQYIDPQGHLRSKS